MAGLSDTESPIVCQSCGAEQSLTSGLIQIHQDLFATTTELAEKASLLKEQLEHVQELYLDLMRQHDNANLGNARRSLIETLKMMAHDKKNSSRSMGESPLEKSSRAFAIWTQKANNSRAYVHSVRQDVACSDSGNKDSGAEDNEGSQGSLSNGIQQPTERDFTTQGTPSGLNCPFAALNGNDMTLSTTAQPSMLTTRSSQSQWSRHATRSKRPSFNDPIRVEDCNDKPMPSVTHTDNSIPVCPIRFLDQHSPEELAQYFETHKHELPRSHEVCVRRYQQDTKSVRHLDAKYGNLASMIQGLGEKHQPWLPEQPEDVEAGENNESTAKVHKWATAVSDASAPDGGNLASPEKQEDDRKPHFDRPLRDIRVGESPNRPWGIPIPAQYQKDLNDSGSTWSRGTTSPVRLRTNVDHQDGTPPKCPFDSSQVRDSHPQPSHVNNEPKFMTPIPDPQAQPHPTIIREIGGAGQPPDEKSSTSRMLFTGPVFIGYPMKDVLEALHQTKNGSKT